MKTMKLFLLAILFTASLHAQNDTAYFDDGSMVIGKGGIKVSIEDGNIVIDGSGITDFVPVDTVTRIGFDGDRWSEFVYEIRKNGAGATKEVVIEKRAYSNSRTLDVPNGVSWPVLTPNTADWGTSVLDVDDSIFIRKPYNPGSFEVVIDAQDTIAVDHTEEKQ